MLNLIYIIANLADKLILKIYEKTITLHRDSRSTSRIY